MAGCTPRKYPDSAETGVVAQPWARLLDAPKPTWPLEAEMFSHMVPVSSGLLGLIMSPHTVSSSDSASAVSLADRLASTS